MYSFGRQIPLTLDDLCGSLTAQSYDINLSYEYIPADYRFQLREKK